MQNSNVSSKNIVLCSKSIRISLRQLCYVADDIVSESLAQFAPSVLGYRWNSILLLRIRSL